MAINVLLMRLDVVKIILGRKEVEVVKEKKVGEQSSVQLGPRQEGYRANLHMIDVNSDECSMELLHTHGDMVQSLPEFAISLGGNANVPIEACAYFSSKEDKVLFQKQLQQHLQSQHHGGDYDGDNTTYHTSTSTSITVQSYAFTFQAHPEYISPTGLNVDYINTVNQIIQLFPFLSTSIQLR